MICGTIPRSGSLHLTVNDPGDELDNGHDVSDRLQIWTGARTCVIACQLRTAGRASGSLRTLVVT